MIKTNIKMRVTPEQSAKVQDICFKNGIEWKHKTIATSYTSIPYLYFYDGEYRIYGTKIKESFTNLNLEEIDPELFIKTNGSCIEKEEFTYPMWFKNKNEGYVVRFDGLSVGEVVYNLENWTLDSAKSDNWTAHTDDRVWVQVENPNLATDKEIEQVINEEYEKDNSINNGGKTDYYQLENAPFPINDFDDFAEWRGLNGNQFNMGKVVWTLNTGRHSGTDYERDLNKIIHYANRELLRLKRDGK